MSGKISSVAKVAKLAFDVVQTAGPLINEYGPAVAEYVKENGPKVKEAASEAAKSFSSAARRASDTVAEKANQVKDGARQAQQVRQDKAQEKAEAKAQAQTIRQTREDVLQSSSYSATAAEFMVSFEAGQKSDAVKSGFFPVSGCFVVLLSSSVPSKSLADYQDVYVGSGLALGEAVCEQLMGYGNPDVYADYKYKKQQQVLLFPCDQVDIEEMKASLVIALQAFESYNAREIGGGLMSLREQIPVMA